MTANPQLSVRLLFFAMALDAATVLAETEAAGTGPDAGGAGEDAFEDHRHDVRMSVLGALPSCALLKVWSVTYGFNVTPWLVIDGMLGLPSAENFCAGVQPRVTSHDLVAGGIEVRVRPFHAREAAWEAPIGHALSIGTGFEGWIVQKASIPEDEGYVHKVVRIGLGYEYRAFPLGFLVDAGGFWNEALNWTAYARIAAGISF